MQSSHNVIYPLSLHDALPICCTSTLTMEMYLSYETVCFWGWGWGWGSSMGASPSPSISAVGAGGTDADAADRKSTRLNSSHGYISYAVFCLNKKRLRCL